VARIFLQLKNSQNYIDHQRPSSVLRCTLLLRLGIVKTCEGPRSGLKWIEQNASIATWWFLQLQAVSWEVWNWLSMNNIDIWAKYKGDRPPYPTFNWEEQFPQLNYNNLQQLRRVMESDIMWWTTSFGRLSTTHHTRHGENLSSIERRAPYGC
jgi:hypothetical protein